MKNLKNLTKSLTFEYSKQATQKSSIHSERTEEILQIDINWVRESWLNNEL